MQNLPKYERPREKALRYGIKSLSDCELLAIILRTGSKDKSVLELAMELIVEFCGISNVFKSNTYDLCKVKGINNIKALELLSIRELFNRIGNQLDKIDKEIYFNSYEEVYQYIYPKVELLENEQITVFYLNNRNCLIYEQVLSIGNDVSAMNNNKFICKTALEQYAKKIVLCHNHPSGNSSPSLSDIDSFYSLKESLKIVQIKLLDHLIIGHKEFYSLDKEMKFKQA